MSDECTAKNYMMPLLGNSNGSKESHKNKKKTFTEPINASVLLLELP